MDRYSVLWIDSARDDLYKIVEYIAAENEQTAHRIYNKIKSKADSLVLFPNKGRVVPEFSGFHINLYREVIEFPWRIIYRIQESNVIVLAIIDGRRDVEDVLFERILK